MLDIVQFFPFIFLLYCESHEHVYIYIYIYKSNMYCSSQFFMNIIKLRILPFLSSQEPPSFNGLLDSVNYDRSSKVEEYR